MEINIISMTINELDNKQTIKEIYSNTNNYKRAIIVYEERIKEQENLLTNIIINKLNKTISIPTIGEIVYFRDFVVQAVFNSLDDARKELEKE